MNLGIIAFLQKFKWDVLAKKNANYFVYSTPNANNEKAYQQSGKDAVKELILEDETLLSGRKPQDISILEIGCGNGRMTEFIADHFKRVYALDISNEMVCKAQDRIGRKKKITWIVGNGSTYPLDNEFIDIVFSWIVFQHFANKAMVESNLKEVYRVLKRNGIAKIQFRGEPAFGGPLRYFKWYYGVNYTNDEISSLLKRLGFSILSITGEGQKEMGIVFQKSA